jgi:lipopolysaccharide export system permease protein
VVYIAETLSLGKLNALLKEKARGSSTINVYLVLYKKIQRAGLSIYSYHFAAVSAMKRRGGMGTNLAIIALAFAFVFLKKL